MPALDEPLIRQKLAELSQYLDELEPLTACEFKEYQADYVKRHAIEKLLELIVEIASDINRHLVEAAGEAPPQTYYSTFDAAGKLGVLPESLAARLATTTGLRNRLVHGDEKIEHAISVHDSRAYGEALELRNVTDYEMLGKVDEDQARTAVENANRFVAHCETYLTTKGYL